MDVTYQALNRLTWLPDRDQEENGLTIAGQFYYDVYFTGGYAGNLELLDPTFTNPIPLVYGGLGSSLSDPGADRILFWDESAGTVTWLTAGSGLVITGTTLTVAGAGLGDVTGPASAVDNRIARFDGATGKVIQNSGASIDDFGNILANNLSGTNTGDQTTSGTADRITVTTGSGNPTIDIAATYAGQNTIVTLGTVTTGTWNASTIAVNKGGTGLTAYTQGDLIYASGATTLSVLAKDANATRYLSNQGTNNNPSWNQVSLTNGVTGTLPIGNGGTNITTYTTGDILYASASNTLSKLSVGVNGQVLSLVAGVPAWADVAVPAAASQSDQETGSSTTVYVSPGRQQYHQSAAKFWVIGTAAVVTGSYNVTSVTANATGAYTINIATDFSSAVWAPFMSCKRLVSGVSGAMVMNLSNDTNANIGAGILPFQLMNMVSGSGAHALASVEYYAGGFGDQ